METIQKSTIEERLIHQTKVDFMGKSITYERIFIMQYDDTLPILAVELYKNGTPYEIADSDLTSTTIKIRMSKSDMHYVYTNILGRDSEVKNLVYVAIDYQMTTCEGNIDPILEIIKNGKSAGSTHILLTVRKNPIQNFQIEEHLESETEMPLAPVAMTGNYNDLSGKLEAGAGIQIVGNIISATTGMDVMVVDELPETGISKVIYLVLKESNEDEGDIFNEYLWINNTWELIGTTSPSITNMVTTDTNQTITGSKTFSNKVTHTNNLNVLNRNKIYFGDNEQDVWTYIGGEQGGLAFNTVTGAFKFYGSLLPFSSTYKDIGSTTQKWADIFASGTVYTGDLKTKGEVRIEAVDNTRIWSVKEDTYGRMALMYSDNGGQSWIASGITFNTTVMEAKTIQPMNGNSYDLGSSSRRWRNAYINALIDSNGNSINTENIVQGTYGDDVADIDTIHTGVTIDNLLWSKQGKNVHIEIAYTVDSGTTFQDDDTIFCLAREDLIKSSSGLAGIGAIDHIYDDNHHITGSDLREVLFLANHGVTFLNYNAHTVSAKEMRVLSVDYIL